VAENPAQGVDDDLDLKPAEAGAMFKFEMFATNFLLGYWKHLLGVVVTALLLILAYGQYRDYTRRTQREAAARISQRMSELPADLPTLAESIARGEPVDTAALGNVGDELVAIANGTRGTAQVEAFLTAAELFRLAGTADKQRDALLNAVENSDGVLHYSAVAGLANLELAQGNGDEAVARLQQLAQGYDGYLAEQAEIDLGLALEHLGKNDEARKVYDEFLQRFPDSSRKAEVELRQGRVGAAQPGSPG
jgi:tetratricopeptide (TPR) repeat protein